MYEKFFGLTQSPFDLTPDPIRFVPSPTHNEALSALYYGIRWHKGFVVVTGEVGTGKTLLLRCLLDQLKDSEDLKYAYLFNSRLSPTEFLQYILADFDLPSSGKNKAEMLLDLSRFLIERGAKGLTTSLIVDEAHQLSEDLLEEIRLLSNLETTSDKLLQIVLVGQPELDEKLDSYGLRQLKQRIAVRAHITSLSLEETTEYISRRLQVAGLDGQATPLFPVEAVVAVQRYSRGLPRLINTICENALIIAYAQQTPTVTERIIEEAARELRLDAAESSDNKSTECGDSWERSVEEPSMDKFTEVRNSSINGPRSEIEVAQQGGHDEPHF